VNVLQEVLVVRVMRRTLLHATVSLVLAGAVRADDPCRLQNLVVGVRDQQGKPVTGLLPASFRGTAGGRTLQVISARASATPPRIVVVVDQSGSVNRETHSFETASAAAESFVLSNAGKAHIAIVFFSDHVLETAGFDTPSNEVLRKIRARQDGKGHTALYDSLIYSASLFGPPEPGDVVYAITDGGNNHGKSQARDVEREFLTKGIRLFSFIWSEKPFQSIEEQEGQSDILNLVKVTGGLEASVESLPPANQNERLNATLQPLYNAMTHFYTLEVKAPELKKGSAWKLEVVDGNGMKQGSIKVIYPKSLASCDAASH
jgi:von Willebrand factor type A domain